MTTFRKHLFVPGKRDYIKGKKRPAVGCILCAILANDENVQRLEVTRDDLFCVSVNLYPYNPGHLMIFPLRHVVDPRQLTRDEVLALHAWQEKVLERLDRLYQPLGYNIGMNVGEASGASIDHLHQHIVPRYHKELGFVDILNGSKIMIEDPQVTLARLREAFAG